MLEWLENRGFDLRAYGAARMWKGYRDALAAYYNACLDAYEARGLRQRPDDATCVGADGGRDAAVARRRALPRGAARPAFAEEARVLLREGLGRDAAGVGGGLRVSEEGRRDRWVLYRRVRGKDVVLAECHGDLVEPAAGCRSRGRASARRPGEARAAPPPKSRDELVAEYTRLAKDALPARAKEEKWPIRFDHCFMRVMLDCAFGKCWYECLDRKKGSAISQIGDADLAAAVAVGKRMEAEGRSAVDELRTRGRCGSGASAQRRS